LALPTDKPLTCLSQIESVISKNPLISPETKNVSRKALHYVSELANRNSPMHLDVPLSDDEKHRLRLYQAGKHKKHSVKASAILMIDEKRSMLEIGLELGAATRTIYRWLRDFNEKRIDFVETKVSSPARKQAKELRKERVIDIIHKQPSFFGINRTSWTYGTIARAYMATYGEHLTNEKIQYIVKSTGCTWRRARTVWTSPDPLYREKISKVMETLRGVKENEAFFFIDEAGPYQVKKYGGRALSVKEDRREIPEHQESKGKVLIIAALEAIQNQVIWRFIRSKQTANIIAILDQICFSYSAYSKVFITWDSISSHSANELTRWTENHNLEVSSTGIGPTITVVPLPSRAQFLNVIEAVFSGMKKAVIANSDYASKKEMEAAISRHFEERNQYFLENPKRAGNKIWDKEAFDLDKLPGGLFKRM
jgi:transposase